MRPSHSPHGTIRSISAKNSFFFVRTCSNSSLRADILNCLVIFVLYHIYGQFALCGIALNNYFCQRSVIKDKPANPNKTGESCGKNVIYEFNVPTGELVIIGEGEMDNYSYYPEISRVTTWESYKNYIESVTIKYGVTNIGNGAFYDCKNLTSIKMAPVLSIGKFAFSGFKSLTYVKIPKGVKSIGESAFWECKRLSSVTIPDSINFIDHHALACCRMLESVIFYGYAQPSIGRFMLKHPVFKDCLQLKEIKVPSNYKGNHFCGKKVFK